MRNSWTKKVLLLLCVQTVILCGGCWKAPAENTANRANAIIKSGKEKVVRRKAPYTNVDLTDTSGTVNRPEEFDMEASSAELQAKNISRGVTKIDGIKRASVVVSGNIAIVGIETEGLEAEGIGTEGELDDARLIKLKQSVEKEVKSIEPTIQHVAVTAAPELIKRITGMDGQSSDTKPDYDDDAEKVVEKLAPVGW